MSLVGCRELLLPDYFKELEASPGAPAFLPLGLGLSYLSNHDISQSTSNQPVSLFLLEQRGALKEGCPSRLTEDQCHSWWLTPPGRGFVLRWDVDMDPGEFGPSVF